MVRRIGQSPKRCTDCRSPSSPPVVHHPAEVRARAGELRATGLTLREVAEELDIPLCTVYSWTGSVMTDTVRAARNERIVEVAKAGYRRPEIAAATGASIATVSIVVRLGGVKFPRGRPRYQ